MNVLQYGVMSECKNVFAFGIFLRIKETSSYQKSATKAWLITLHHGDPIDTGHTAPRESRCSGDAFDTETVLSASHQETLRCSATYPNWITVTQCYRSLLYIWFLKWARKRIFLVSSDSGRCSNDHCAYNILQNKENTFITRIPHVRINETYNQSVNNDFQSHGTKKSKYKSWTISKTDSKSTEKTRFVLTAGTIILSG